MAVLQSSFRSVSEIVQLYLDAYRTGDTACLDEIISSEFVDHSFPGFSGPAGVQKSISCLHQSFADVELTVEDCVCTGDRAAVRVVTTATHIGAFAGKPGTGKRVTWSACDFIRVREGQVTDLWSVQDTISLLRGIGVLNG